MCFVSSVLNLLNSFETDGPTAGSSEPGFLPGSQRNIVNLFDGVIIIVLAYCLIRGIFRGLIKEISSLVGVLTGFYAAYSYYPLVVKFLARWISNAGYLSILSFLILFFVVFFVISILGVIINYLLKIAFLGWVDRICGALFGAIKGVLIVSVVMIPLISFLPKGATLLKDSLLAPRATLVSEKMVKVVSKDLKSAFTNNLSGLKKSWKKKV